MTALPLRATPDREPAPRPSRVPAPLLADEAVDWRAFREARDESGAQVCPLCGVRRWYEADYDEGCCAGCAAADEAEAVEDLAALAGALA